MPQNPGLERPTPLGHITGEEQLISNLTAILLRGKQEVGSVVTLIVDSSPIIDHGEMPEGIAVPPDSKPKPHKFKIFVFIINIILIQEGIN